MTICANYTKTVVFCCAFCRMVSGLAVVWCRVLSWCGSVAHCEALLASFYGFMVSSTSKALKWLCGSSGASGRVSRCWHGVGCGCLWLWCGAVTLCEVILAFFAVWWSLVWLCVSGCLCGSSGVLCVVLSLWCCRAVWCRSLLWWSGVLSSGLLWWCLLWSGLLVSGHSVGRS